MIRVLALSLIVMVCGCGKQDEPSATKRDVYKLSVVKRYTPEAETALPSSCDGGFIVSDDDGWIRRFDSDLQEVWSVSNSPLEYVNSGVVDNNCLYVGSSDGVFSGFNASDGAVLWTNAVDAAFSHLPICGKINEKRVIWELSADDGRVFCFDAEDGRVIWESEDTNRSDGGMILWSNRLVYGNCDGSAHIFNADDGSKISSVPVGDSDQMAGTAAVSSDGMLFIGTRSGNIAVIDLKDNKLISTFKVSEDEVFVAPVGCGDDRIAFGTGEGRLLSVPPNRGKANIDLRANIGFPVEYLLFDGMFIYALGGGVLSAYNDDLELKVSCAVGDSLGGISLLGAHYFAVKADNAILFVEGSFK